MQKFIVPQFIDIENKILGPITVRQFVTVAVGSVLIFAAYKLSDFTLFLFWFAVITILTAVIAFVKFNGHPFHIFMLNMLATYKKPMLRVWFKEEYAPPRRDREDKKDQADAVFIPKKSISSEKLSELALIIDTGGIYKGEEEANKMYKTLYEEQGAAR